jgi:hypothetical protein
MVAAIVAALQVTQGRREELIEALGKANTHAEGLGANMQLRSTSIGGETAGRLTRIFLFENEAARAAYQDRVREEPPSPLAAVMQAADPPATLVARSYMNEVSAQPNTEIPAAAPVMSATSFRLAPGHSAEANSALMAAVSLRESLGGKASQWQLMSAGANTGLRVLSVQFDSFSAMAELNAKVQERNEGSPGPVALALQSGTLSIERSGLSTLVEV